MIVIDLIGKPCSGKSVLASKLFYELKIKGYNVELVTEYAKDLCYEENKFKINYQLQVFTEQLWRLKRLENKVDIVISDTSLLLGLIYSTEKNPYFNDLLLWEYKNIKHLTYFIQNNFTYQESGRFHNYEESLKVESSIIDMFKQYDINHTVLKEDHIDIILNDIYKNKI